MIRSRSGRAGGTGRPPAAAAPDAARGAAAGGRRATPTGSAHRPLTGAAIVPGHEGRSLLRRVGLGWRIGAAAPYPA